MTTPAFKLSPAGNGRYQMLAYDPARPECAIEMYVPASSDAGAIAKCRFEARYAIRKCVTIRRDDGHVIYDGAALPTGLQVAA
jgi:hypothetical protein